MPCTVNTHVIDLEQNLRGSLEKVSRFLQCPLLEDELTSAQRSCSFNTMRENCMVNYTLIPQEIMDHRKGKFMRKGEAFGKRYLGCLKELKAAYQIQSKGLRKDFVGTRNKQAEINISLIFLTGQIGDWVNTFSQEQSLNFDVVYASKMADSKLTFLWEAKKSSIDTEILPLYAI